MGYKLIVIESPNKLKTISKILGSGYLIRATVGHINDLAKTGKYNLGIDIDNNFELKYEILPDKKDKIKSIFEAAKKADEILIASDPDREGEAIAFAVADQLKKLKKPIHRVLFHEITKSVIKNGLENKLTLNRSLNEAQQARRALDRLVGFLVSGQLSARYKATRPDLRGLSAGRVQSVALRLISDREQEIISFVPEKYFNIFANFEKNKIKFQAKYSNKITDEEMANQVKSDLDSSKFIISDIKESIQKVSPFPPLTTAKLQKYAASRLKFSASKTMKCAQSLYEKGYVTYIRTDSIRSSKESLDNLREWLLKNNMEISDKEINYATNSNAQDAHEAIRPTDINKTPEKLLIDDEEKKLYKLIWQFFVASQMRPILYNVTKIDVKAGNHLLKIFGKILKEKGWSSILEEDSKNKDIILPNLKLNEELKLVKPKIIIDKKETKPPARYNDGTLTDELEKKGIGRPSTYAAILSKLSNKNYVTKNKNTYFPTELGMEIVKILCKHYSFMDINYTKNMELSLDNIESGKDNYNNIIKNFFSSFKEELAKAYLSNDKKTKIKCDKCNSETVLKHGMYGYYVLCVECKGTQSVDLKDQEVVLTSFKRELVDNVVCPKCSSGMVEKNGKFGPFYACENYPKCRGNRKKPFGKKCSKCLEGELYITIFDNKPKLACMNYPYCKNIENLPKNYTLDWVNPKELKSKKNKIIEKIIK